VHYEKFRCDDRLISMGIGINVGAIIGGILDYIINKK